MYQLGEHKYKLTFEDQGQDMYTCIVDKSCYIIDTQPVDIPILKNYKVVANKNTLKVGERISLKFPKGTLENPSLIKAIEIVS